MTIIEQLPEILLDLDPVSGLTLRRLLQANNIEIKTNTRFTQFAPEAVITDQGKQPVAADVVVIAMGARPNNELDQILNENKWKLGTNYLCLGDAKKVGKIYEAVHDTYWNVTNLLADYL